MSLTQIIHHRKLSVGVTALVLAVGVAVVALATQSKEAVSAPVESAGAQFEILKPAVPATMDEVSADGKLRLELLTHRSGSTGSGELSRVGVVDRPNGDEVTVAGIGEDICAFFAKGIGVCDIGPRAAAGKTFGAEPIGCEGYRVLGLAPDGVTSIAIDSGADGVVDRSLPVTSNVYGGILDPVQTVATGLDKDGEVRFSVAMPLGSYFSMNEACK